MKKFLLINTLLLASIAQAQNNNANSFTVTQDNNKPVVSGYVIDKNTVVSPNTNHFDITNSLKEKNLQMKSYKLDPNKNPISVSVNKPTNTMPPTDKTGKTPLQSPLNPIVKNPIKEPHPILPPIKSQRLEPVEEPGLAPQWK